MNFSLEEFDLLLTVITVYGDNLEARSRYIKHAVTLEYYEKRLKRLSDLRLKLIRLRQDQIILRFKLKARHNKDTVGRVVDPDL